MTIAEKLYKSDPDTLFEIIVIYQLEDMARLYFPDKLVNPQCFEIEDEEREREYMRLMQPSSYTGKVERRRGAIIQPHRVVIK
jgi:hypothetical protein